MSVLILYMTKSFAMWYYGKYVPMNFVENIVLALCWWFVNFMYVIFACVSSAERPNNFIQNFMQSWELYLCFIYIMIPCILDLNYVGLCLWFCCNLYNLNFNLLITLKWDRTANPWFVIYKLSRSEVPNSLSVWYT